MEDEDLKITDNLIRKLKSAKIFKDHNQEVNSLDFSKDGKKIVTCDDKSLNIYDIEHGKKTKTLYLNTKEIESVKFTHHNEAVICATKKDFRILYWSIHENEVIKMFQGHTDTINSMEINPSNDQFLTTSKDQSLRLWDLNSKEPGCEAILDLSSKNSNPVANFDPCGLIVAVAYQETIAGTSFTKIALYDLKNYEDGCFSNWKYGCSEIKILKFSNSGKYILCACAENYIMILNAYNGKDLAQISSYQNENSIIEASFTPCSNYVVSGSENGIIHFWKAETGEHVHKLEDKHFLKAQVVKFCPKYFILASACKNLILWIPQDFNDSA